MKTNLFIISIPNKITFKKLKKNIFLIKGQYGYNIFVKNKMFKVMCDKKKKKILFFTKYNFVKSILAFISFFKNLIYNITCGINIILKVSGAGFKVIKNSNTIDFFMGFSHIKQFYISNNLKIDILSKREKSVNIFSICLLNIFKNIYILKKLYKTNIFNGKGIFLLREKIILKKSKELP